MPEFIAFLSLAATMLVTLAFLVIGWRAMRAHEKLAEAVTQFTNTKRQEVRSELATQGEATSQPRLYKQFLSEDESRCRLPAKERHEAFRIWLESNDA